MTKTDVKQMSAYGVLWLEVIEDGDLITMNDEGSESIYEWNGATVLLDDNEEAAIISYPDGKELEVKGDVERWVRIPDREVVAS